MKKLFFQLACMLSAFAASAQPSFIRDSIDTYINKGISDWDIPGLAVVIVKDGQVVLMKGYGVKSIETKQPVNEQTLFMIASNTKLFTATSLALLEARGKINLDDNITKYFPDYKLYDETTTKLVSIRDLLTHRIGTKTFQGDFTFWNTALTRQQIMNKMRLLKPSQRFRQDYGYCNSCFLTAGEVIPKVTGRQWEEFVQDTILTPLQMKSTMVLSTGVEKQANVALPYTTSYTNTLKQVPFDNWNNLAPAASIISNVSDLSHWLMFQLDSGRYNGKQVIPFNVLQKTRDVNIVTGSRRSSVYPVHFRGYGLGLFASDYNGRQIYWHTGGAGGMVSNVCFVPEERLGIAILTNNDNQNFFELLRYQILDAYMGVPYKNRSESQLAGFKKDMKAQVEEISKWNARALGNKPELPLESYTGEYYNELYGPIRITKEQEHLMVHFGAKPDLHATLTYLDKGDWLMEYDNIEYGIFVTRFDIKKNKVIAVTTRQNEFVEFDPYTFKKK